MRVIFYFLFPVFCFALTKMNSDPDPGQQILSGLKQWHENHPQEKIYVQTDKEKYLAGEQLWLKLWCTIENKPSFLSRIVYVDITDANGNVVEKKMYQLDNTSSANGVIDINKEIKSGNYSINGYSLWMLNYPLFIFKKNLFIYNSDYNPKKSVGKTGNNRVTFFPEGGDMVEEVNNRIAFKAVNESGYPVAVKGSVYNNSGNKIVDFQSHHDGMGVFDLQPAHNTTYIAKVVWGNDVTAEYKLPIAKKEGATLQVQNTSPSRLFIIVNRGQLNKEKYNKLFVVAQINGNPVYKADFNFDEGISGASIIKKNLTAGIIQITLFDSTGNPLAERLAFISNHQVVDPVISLEKISTNKRAQNTYSFRLDSLLLPSISVAVVSSSLDNALNRKENIASSILLSSDIKGYIHNPGYYLSNKEPVTMQNLDLLLMTQGWRRFTWKQIKGQENISLKYPVETFMNIKGKVTKAERPDPITSGFVTMVIKGDDSTSILSNAYLTDKGEFIIDSLNFKIKAEVSYQGTNNKKGQLPVDVTIYPAFIDTLKISGYKPESVPDSSLVTDINQLPLSIQSALKKLDTAGVKVLQSVIIKGKRISKADSLQKEYVSAMFENSDQTLVIPENRNYINIWQYLNANVPGLNVNPFEPGGVTNVTFGRFQGMSLDSGEQVVKFLLNEIPVSADVIDGINPADVALIKIYKGATGFALGADAGAISVYTKKGVNTSAAIFDKKFLRSQKIGFAISREFYNPNYTAYPDLNKNEIDTREVIYWNPNIKPAKNGSYLINFHNSDVTNSFKLIIQGIDANGQLIYKEQIIK